MGKIKVSLIFIAGALCVVCLVGNVGAVTAAEDVTINAEQKAILDKFRETMSSRLYKDYMKEDVYLLRWLRAREFDVKAAEKLLDENLRWRRDNKIDTIQEEDWSDFTKDYPYSVDGFDKDGRPVGTVSIGDWNIRRASVTGKLPRLQRYMDKMMDEISMKVLRLRSDGKNVTRWVLLTNVEGFNVVQHACPACTSLWVNFLRSYESHFPSTAHTIIAINSPETFNLLLRLLKPSIPASSRETVKILGTNKQQWMSYLDERISPDQRTKEYGGTKKD